MNPPINARRLFLASCLALIATSMAFSIRADIIPALKSDFNLTAAEMGQAAGPGLWGFTITIVLGGMLVDLVGMKAVLLLALVGHVAGVLLTIFSTGFSSLYVATLLIGLANGAVEAVINPLVATLNPSKKTKYLNILHAWWPGGLVIGGLAGYALTKTTGLDAAGVALATVSIGWKVKMALILVPTALYGFLIVGQTFPATERAASGVTQSEMWREAVRPLFLLLVVLMLMTTATELGPDQWIGNLLQNLVGIQGILLLVYTAGIMFVLRQFCAGPIVDKLGPLGVLVGASVLSCLGLLSLSYAQTAFAVVLAATVFALGKTFFWPTMVGVVAERFPKGGALLMGILGGAGMFSAGWLMTPFMGSIQDHYAVQTLSPAVAAQVVSHGGIDPVKAAAITNPQVQKEIDHAQQVSAGMTYRWVAVVPAILSVVFLGLYLYFRSLGGYAAVRLPDKKKWPVGATLRSVPLP